MASFEQQINWGTEIEYNLIKVCNDGSVIFKDKVNKFLSENKKVSKWLKINTEKTSTEKDDEGKEKFNRVVFVEYPRKGVWAVAFVTGHATLRGIPPGFISVFIPTVPNPTSGFHLMVNESEVVESGLSVENAFKLILSLGVAVPHE